MLEPPFLGTPLPWLKKMSKMHLEEGTGVQESKITGKLLRYCTDEQDDSCQHAFRSLEGWAAAAPLLVIILVEVAVVVVVVVVVVVTHIIIIIIIIISVTITIIY